MVVDKFTDSVFYRRVQRDAVRCRKQGKGAVQFRLNPDIEGTFIHYYL